jgi:DnaK suppressor protein
LPPEALVFAGPLQRDSAPAYLTFEQERETMKTKLSTEFNTRLFQGVLEKEAAELRGTLRNRAGATIESVAEECERTMLAGQRELTIELVDRASKRLRDVESALHRLAGGGYGACTDCDEPISVRRLTAIPWASRCVRCQEIADRGTRFPATAQATHFDASWLSGDERFGAFPIPGDEGGSR